VDQWTCFSEPGRFPLILKPVVAGSRLNKVLIDGGSGLNVLFSKTLKKMKFDITDMLTKRNPLLTRASRSLVFSFAFFHSLAGLGRGVEGGDDDRSAFSASPRLLFFDASVFELFTGDVFILQVTGVFTCIHSGATAVVDYDDARV
jgi:hypothetical protein